MKIELKNQPNQKRFDFNEAEHYYFRISDGKRLYGITNVLSIISKPNLIQWAANQAIQYLKDNSELKEPDVWLVSSDDLEKARYAHRRKKEDAGNKGKDIHSIIENKIKEAIKNNNGFLEGSYTGEKQVEHFVKWGQGKRFIASEKQLFSESLWVAGTCDMFFEMDGKTYVGDIKTTSGMWDRVPFFQCAAYGLMLKETEDIDISGYCIVRIGKDGSFDEHWSYDIEGDKNGFLNALGLFKQLESFKIKK